MNEPPVLPPAVPSPALARLSPHDALPPEKALRRLFLTLFLRGRGARGLRKDQAPKSVGTKLAGSLVLYALFGIMALVMVGQSVFTVAVYLHALTLMFVGMFAAASAGEVLFNREEADILLHRPVTPRDLLRAKVSVLVQVSLWLAGALNVAGLFVGMTARDGGRPWMFPLSHLLSTALLAFFCISSVVLVYQLCLRWFGRERLDGLMTTAQVGLALAAVLGGQLIPRLFTHFEQRFALDSSAWWIWLLPPAWFAGIDDALTGSGGHHAWALAAAGVVVTAALTWLVFSRLARDYALGLQALNENVGTRPRVAAAGRRWLDRFARSPIIRLWLRDPVTHGTFLLVAAYLVRDRDVKLRVYPGLAPLLIMPLILMFPGRHGAGSGPFGVAFAGAYLGLIPLMGISLLQFSQQWQAADLFRAVPLPGPAPLNRGLRRAVLFMLAGPVVIVYALLSLLLTRDPAQLALMLPGMIALPIFALIPCLRGGAVPLSIPADEAKSAKRGVLMIGAVLASLVLGGLSMWAWSGGWFLALLAIESAGVLALHFSLTRAADCARWSPID